MSELEQAVKEALSALYRVEVKGNGNDYLQEVAYAVPVMFLTRLAALTNSELPESLKLFQQR